MNAQVREARRARIRSWKAEQWESAIERSKDGLQPGHKFCVIYLRPDPAGSGPRREVRTPWFYSRERAHRARELLASRYGRAIVFVD